MFDRHTLVMGRAYPSHVTVEEKRAPTDASVQLLRELEAAAHEKVLASFRLEDCPIDCVVHHMRCEQGDEDRFIVQYRLGGKTHRVQHTHRRAHGDSAHQARQRLADELVKVVSESVAVDLLAPAFAKAQTRWV
jgi:hypothetical protein